MFGSSIGHLSLVAAIDWQNAFQTLVGIPLKILIIVASCIISWLILTSMIKRVTKKLVNKAESDRLTVARRTQHDRPERGFDVAKTPGSRRGHRVVAALDYHRVHRLYRDPSRPCPARNQHHAPTGECGRDGVALGFGAQSLVKDYLSGIFLILEDQYGVGDVVDLGPVVGTVEDVTLRITRLRDMSGVVWYVRNGEVLRVANRSRDGHWQSSTFPCRTTKILIASNNSSSLSLRIWTKIQSTTQCCWTSPSSRALNRSVARRDDPSHRKGSSRAAGCCDANPARAAEGDV